MGLPKIIKIPCHHVLANQNDLKLKNGAPPKRFFNTNLGIGIIKKNYFFVRFFDIHPYVFTQISMETAHWMQNSIPHPMSTQPAYFWQPPIPQKQEIPKKSDDKYKQNVCRVGIRWMRNLIPHPTSSPDQNFSKNTGIYVENTNKKSSFFL